MNTDLEVRHCRVLLAVHAHGGVAAAARALGLAQSTVSETLLSLERVVGAQVTLRRPGREAALTPAAETLLPHVRALVAASDAGLAAFIGQSHGIIRLGAVESISSFLLPEPLRAFRARWPQIDIRIAIGLCEDLRRRVDRFDLDAALTIERAGQAMESETAFSRVLSPAQLRLVASPRHPLAKRALGRNELLTQTFLFADPDGAFNVLLKAWLGAGGRSARFESAGSIDGVKRGVEASDEIGVLPGYAVAEELRSGALVEIEVRDALPEIALHLTTRSPAPPSGPLQDLVTRIGEAFRRAA